MNEFQVVEFESNAEALRRPSNSGQLLRGSDPLLPLRPQHSACGSRGVSKDTLLPVRPQHSAGGSRGFSAFSTSLCADSDTAFSVSPKRRPGTGRFNAEELSCFKRIPTPSPFCIRKVEAMNSETGLMKAKSEGSLHSLPSVSRRFKLDELSQFGKVYHGTETVFQERKVEFLPMEDKLAHVLERIYPRSPWLPSVVVEEEQEQDRKGSRKHLRRTASHKSFTSEGSASVHAPEPEVKPLTASQLTRNDPLSPRPAMTRSHQILPPKPPDSKEHGHHSRHSYTKANRRLLQFRQKILDRFSTMQSAFESFAADGNLNAQGELSRRDFSRFLSRHFTGLARDEHDRIFDFLDNDKSGSLSMEEFHIAIEAASPVKNLEDLRRKWISLGYPTMRSALMMMDLGKHPSRRYALPEFGALLGRVGVEDPGEHENVFSAIYDPTSRFTGTVTLEMLAAGMASVSPSLLLEEVRDKLIKAHGDLAKAFSAIDQDQGETLELSEFMKVCMTTCRLSSYESSKAFRLIDMSHSRKINRKEFLSALALSEPNLYLEEIRRKVRQRFRSIREAMRCASLEDEELRAAMESLGEAKPPVGRSSSPQHTPSATPAVGGRRKSVLTLSEAACLSPAVSPQKSSRHSHMTAMTTAMGNLVSQFQDSGEGVTDVMLQTPDDFQSMLAQTELTAADIKVLFDLADLDKDGTLSPFEFERGIRIFAPGCAIEDLRLAAIGKYPSVIDAFSSISQELRETLLDGNGMLELLTDLDLVTDDVQADTIIDVVECHKDGGITVSELMAALQAGAPGTQTKLSPEQIDARAKQQVKWQLAPFHRSATDLRACVREKLDSEDDHRGMSMWELTTKPEKHPGGLEETLGKDGQKEQDKKKKGSLSPKPVAVHWPTRQSSDKVCKLIRSVSNGDPHHAVPIIDKMQGYFATAGDALCSNEGLLTAQHSRFQDHDKCRQHYAALSKSA